ncbi:MAG: CDP-glycerol glycerophosphotransferase family protein, partial [Frankiales bacterium]|nr:CDP-glycerol glycerophosphotransferase family protein [Frankiales bacterium]
LLLAAILLRLAFLLALVPVRRRAVGPVSTRGVDLTGLALPPSPPEMVLTRSAERVHGVTTVGVVAAALAVATTTPAVAFVGVGAVVVAGLAAVGYLGWLLLSGRGCLSREQLLVAVAERVSRNKPEVMLYHSGDPDTAYQANMWLATVDALPHGCVVMLRERPVMRELAGCRSPVLCIPDPVDFMNFSLPDVRVALYTANVGKTIHMLREPGVSHVFIGHGDSDKSASSNPFSKVYTEIWVAGPAGRDRYRRAGIGIDDADVVEVGRPQLAGIEHFTGSVRDPLTVLYAPTWEGWTNDPAHTSLTRTGPTLVERLVATPGVRVVYKPHPLTGTVSPATAAADAAIRATISRAGSGDGHRVVAGPTPSLYDCFNDADALVADISSVLTDFVESQKPYLVVNVSGRSDAEFRTEFPSVSAAYLLDPGMRNLGEVLDLIRTSDPMRDARRELKHYLLGADEPDATTRFTRAVTAARDRAVAQCPVRPVLGATVG